MSDTNHMEAIIVVILIRTLVPLTILRWPLLGGILAIVADASDLVIFDWLGYDQVRFRPDLYHPFDKFFDTYYLFLEFLVTRRWSSALARRTAFALFMWRFVGFLAYEITRERAIFFFAPNIFENFYLFCVIASRLFFRFRLESVKALVIILAAVGIPKIFQEYHMHYKQFETWRFVRENFLFWLY